MSVLHVLNNLLDVLVGVEVRDLAVVENIVDILNEGLIDDLSIGQEEHMRLAIDTSSFEQGVDHVLTPLLHTVALDHFEAHHFVASDESGQL